MRRSRVVFVVRPRDIEHLAMQFPRVILIGFGIFLAMLVYSLGHGEFVEKPRAQFVSECEKVSLEPSATYYERELARHDYCMAEWRAR